MTKHVDVVYEDGVLRPLEPLPFAEKQRLHVTVSDVDTATQSVDYNPRTREFEWLRTNGPQYAGKWVAIEGDQLISVGESAKSVMDQARAQGVEHPLLSHIPREPRLPFGGW